MINEWRLMFWLSKQFFSNLSEICVMNFLFNVHSLLLFHCIIPFLQISYFLVYQWFTNLTLSSTFFAHIGGWDSWRRETRDPDQRFHEVPCMRRRYILYFFFWLINNWCSSLYKSFSNGYCISIYDYMLMIIGLGFHVILIILLYMWSIWFEEGRSLFCRSLGLRSKRRDKESLDTPSICKVWTLLMHECYLYLCFQYMYVSVFIPLVRWWPRIQP